MTDGITLDQLRVLDAVARDKSFSAAGRRLRRVQSAVSQAIANLEAQLGTPLFLRGRREVTLTPSGERLWMQAQRALTEVDGLKALAKELEGGLEPQVSLAVDSLYPVRALADLCRAFAKAFPTVDLRLDTDTLSAVRDRILSGRASLGVVAAPALDTRLVRRAMPSIRMLPVVGVKHPLALLRGRIRSTALREHVQIVLSERGASTVPDQAVASTRTWRVADLSTKQALLCAGLGWGNLPEHLAKDDLERGRLKLLSVAALSRDEGLVPMYAVHAVEQPLGPAHHWLLDRLAPP